jgi:DNA-binding SARP family transcriptional activator
MDPSDAQQPPGPAPRLELTGAAALCMADGQRHALERRDAALLAYVCVEGRASRARLIDLLWPGKASDLARNSLRQRLHKLRRTAGHALVEGEETLVLAAGVQADGSSRGPTLATPPADATAVLLGAYQFDDLAAFDDWLQTARGPWQQARRTAWAAAADVHERAGRFDDALGLARALADSDSLDEAAHARVMRLLYLRGDRAGALAAYRRCCAVLAQELGVTPGEATQALARLAEQPAAPAPALGVPVALLRTPQLVGREPAWRAVGAAWARRRVLALSGEPGVGKSRLAEEFASTQGDAVVRVGARPGDAVLPFALMTRLLRAILARGAAPNDELQRRELARLLPELGAAPDAAAEPARLAHAIRATIEQAVAQGVAGLVIDDLQFADDASVEALVDWLGDAAAATLPHLLIARSGEWPATLAHWCTAEAGRRCEELPLPPLDVSGVRTLLQSLALPGLDASGWSSRLWRHTGGNPLFTLETLIACQAAGGPQAFDDASALPAPEGVARLIEQRLGRLSSPALRLARLMAVAGADATPELLAHVLGTRVLDLVDAWAELRAAHVARDAGFSHDLVQAAVSRAVPPEIARSLHGDIGRALQARAAPAARVAAHLWAAEAWLEAADASLRAAQDAARQSRRDEEIALLTQAVAGFGRAGEGDAAFDARLRRAHTMALTGSYASAADELAALANEAAGDAQALRVLLLRAKAALAGGDIGGTVPLAQDALTQARRAGVRAAEFEAGQLLASAWSQTGRSDDALALLDELSPLLSAHADPAQRCAFHGTLGYVLGVGGRRRLAATHLRNAAQLADAQGDAAEAITLWSNLAGTLSMLGQVAEAADVAQRARALTLHAGDKAGIAVASNETVLGLAWTALGRFAAAEAILGEALERFRVAGAPIWVAVTEGMLANLYIALGQVARARRILGPLPADTPPARRARRLAVEARIERAAGRSDAMHRQSALALLDSVGNRAMDRLTAVLAFAPQWPAEELLPLLRDVRKQCEAEELDGLACTALAREAQALFRLGQLDDAAARAREAGLLARQCQPFDLPLSEFWWILHQAQAAAGDADAAGQALGCAVDWLHSVLPQVPAPYRDSFLHRQPVHRALLAAAGGLPGPALTLR